MNRRERRQAARDQRRRTPVLIAGDGIVAAELGERYEARPAARLAAKQPGVHRWIATGAWVLSDIAVAHVHDDLPKLLDHETLLHLSVGCWDCEQPLGVIQPGTVCPAEGED